MEHIFGVAKFQISFGVCLMLLICFRGRSICWVQAYKSKTTIEYSPWVWPLIGVFYSTKSAGAGLLSDSLTILVNRCSTNERIDSNNLFMNKVYI